MKTAVIGLGLMGAEVALRLRGQGIEVIGWNRSPGRRQAAEALGIPVAASAADAIGAAELAISR